MNRSKALISLIIVFSVFFSSSTYAVGPGDYNLPTQKTLPGSFSYNLKRAKEKFQGYLLFSSESKIKYQSTLLEKRISEIASLISDREYDPLELAGGRFAAQAGEVTALSVQVPQTKSQVFNEFNRYQQVLAKMRDNFEANSGYWLVLQQDIDSLKILSEKLK